MKEEREEAGEIDKEREKDGTANENKNFDSIKPTDIKQVYRLALFMP